MKNLSIKNSLIAVGLVAAAGVNASTDYGPAIWHPICNANWYSSGFGHKFHVIHDIEGYYASTIAWFDNCSMSSASIHFVVNGKKDATSDAAAGEITQLGVRTAQYAWHARCWNQHSTGTEHEGFASNPAWYTDVQYQASAGITAHMSAVFGWPKDRNHIVGHGEKSRSAWRTYAEANLGIDADCNSHTDPGPYWDWAKYMGMVNPSTGKTAVQLDNGSAVYTGTWAVGSSATDKLGADYRYKSTAAVSEPATWTTGLNTTATWNVKAWWPQGGNRSATAPYIVTHGGGSTTVAVNQQINGGKWNTLGSWSMSSGKVQLSCWTSTGFIVVADGVRWD
jgi:N-acetyl-anhydromuramyl-L-alanine amidase AmpD